MTYSLKNNPAGQDKASEHQQRKVLTAKAQGRKEYTKAADQRPSNAMIQRHERVPTNWFKITMV